MPFDATLNTKISPLINDQLPDYISSDHQVFVNFIKSYYQFLECAELVISASIDHFVQETISISYILDEVGEKIVTETGSGTLSKFVVNETITGTTSKATATVLVDDLNSTTARLFISSQQHFIIGEEITGGTSGATATITTYRGNPVQNIQQLQDFSDPDNTIDTFLNELVNQFIKIIPRTVASDLSKRNLIKSIKDLYAAKGTSEATKLFLRILFDEEAQVTYPNKFMIRASKGDWRDYTYMRVIANSGASGAAIIGETITGSTSGATAVVTNSTSFQQGPYSVTELSIETDTVLGTFVDGETIIADSLTSDVAMSFVVYPFITSVTIDNAGLLYSKGDKIDLDSTIGNGFAEIIVGEVSLGGIDNVLVKTEGSGYREGEPLVFTPHADDTDVKLPTAFVSVVGGSMVLEDSDSTDGYEDYIQQESGTSFHIGLTKVLLDDVPFEVVQLERTDAAGTDAGHYLLNETDVFVDDAYATASDRFILEEASVDTSDKGAIKRLTLTSPGLGFSKLPTVTVTTKEGTLGVLYTTPANIGQVLSAELKDGGFNYTEVPKSSSRAHFVLQGVTGDFAIGRSLTTHDGIVKDWDSTRNLLTVTIDDAERMKQEFAGIYNQKLQLEQFDGDAHRIIANSVLENQCIGDDGLERDAVIIFEDATLGTYVGEGSSVLVYWGSILIEDGGTDGAGTDAGDRIIMNGHYRGGVYTDVGARITQSGPAGLSLTPLSPSGPIIMDNHFIGDETTVNLITESGDYITYESFGQGILSEDQAGGDDYLIHETETFVADFLLTENTTTTSYLNSEIERNYLTEIISDGVGSGTITSNDVVRLSLQNGVSSVSIGYFATTDHQLSEFTVKLQDSYYYQDFSYEVAVGQSTGAYLNELKGGVHPAGFIPFGKVSLASLLAATIQIPTAGGVVDFTADTTTFTPELASILEAIFRPHIKRRLGANDDYVIGTLFEQIILNGTDGISSNAGEGIIIEAGLDGGRLMTEAASIIPSVIEGFGGSETPRDVTLFSIAKVSMKLPWGEPILGTGLQFFAGMSSGGITEFGGIELEDGYRTAGPTVMRDRLLLDGDSYDNETKIANQGELMELELYSNPNVSYGPSFNDIELIDEFDLVTESGTGNYYLNYETATPAFSNKRIRTEGLFTSNVSLGDLSRPSIMLAEDGTTTLSTDIDAIMPEDALDGQCATEQLTQEDDYKFIQETRTGLQIGGGILLEATRFQIEDGDDVGTMPSINKIDSKFVTFTRPAKIHVHTRGRIAWQDETEQLTFVLEDGDNLLLDGINSAAVDAGSYVVSEKFSYALHPYTYDGGFALLNGTDGSSTNAGEYLEYEKGTWDSLPGSYIPFIEDLPESWDTSEGYFDSSLLKFDREFGDG